jgi:hypothetical protein
VKPERSPGGHRLDSRTQVEQLRFVRGATRRGLTAGGAIACFSCPYVLYRALGVADRGAGGASLSRLRRCDRAPGSKKGVALDDGLRDVDHLAAAALRMVVTVRTPGLH